VAQAALNQTAILNQTPALNETFVFSWTKVPGTDDNKLREYLGKRYNIDWIYKAEIVKSEDGKIIEISREDKILSLALNDEESEVLLKIDSITTDKFIAKMENGELNIYSENLTLNETAAAIEEAPVEAIVTETVAGTALNATATTSKPVSAEVVTEAAPVDSETVEIAPVEIATEEAPVEVETAEAASAEAVTEAAPEVAGAQPAPAEAIAGEAVPVAAAAKTPTAEAAPTGKADKGYTIEGVVFEDLNGNGVKNVNEEGLANWTVNLEQPEGAVIKSVNTASDGKFVFLNQLPGEYTIREVLQPGWTLVSPAEGKLTVVVINESVVHLGFANKRS